MAGAALLLVRAVWETFGLAHMRYPAGLGAVVGIVFLLVAAGLGLAAIWKPGLRRASTMTSASLAWVAVPVILLWLLVGSRPFLDLPGYHATLWMLEMVIGPWATPALALVAVASWGMGMRLGRVGQAWVLGAVLVACLLLTAFAWLFMTAPET